MAPFFFAFESTAASTAGCSSVLGILPRFFAPGFLPSTMSEAIDFFGTVTVAASVAAGNDAGVVPAVTPEEDAQEPVTVRFTIVAVVAAAAAVAAAAEHCCFEGEPEPEQEPLDGDDGAAEATPVPSTTLPPGGDDKAAAAAGGETGTPPPLPPLLLLLLLLSTPSSLTIGFTSPPSTAGWAPACLVPRVPGTDDDSTGKSFATVFSPAAAAAAAASAAVAAAAAATAASKACWSAESLDPIPMPQPSLLEPCAISKETTMIRKKIGQRLDARLERKER